MTCSHPRARLAAGTLLLAALLGCSPRNSLQPREVVSGDCAGSPWPTTSARFAEYVGDGASVGDNLIEWSLRDQRGCVVDFTQLLGAVTMLDVSSVWCGPCNEAASTSMEVLDAARALHRSTWLTTILVQDAVAAPAQVSDAADWAEKYALEYPVVVDLGEATRNDYGVVAFPVFLFVSPTGEVYERIEGKPDDSEMLSLLQRGVEDWAADLRPEDEIPAFAP